MQHSNETPDKISGTERSGTADSQPDERAPDSPGARLDAAAKQLRLAAEADNDARLIELIEHARDAVDLAKGRVRRRDHRLANAEPPRQPDTETSIGETLDRIAEEGDG